MSLPKSKYNININPPKVGTEYLKYGLDRIEKLMLDTNRKTNYLPRTITMKDIDQNFTNEYLAKNDKVKLVLNGEEVPYFFLSNERWGEFSKTWKYADKDKNVAMPYITVRRTNKEKGTRMGDKFRVPQGRNFVYNDVPILDEGEVINLRFKIPQPVNVDMDYEVRLFTKYRKHTNEYDEKLFKAFASIQDYMFIKGNPMPIYLEDMQESNTVDNIDGDRFYMSIYQFKVKGFIQNEDEFEITRTTREPKFNFGIH